MGKHSLEAPTRPDDVVGVKPRLESIQAMRGIAALLVVLVHSIDLMDQGEQISGAGVFSHLGHFDNLGAIGLDLFFVISGFVMAFSVAGMNRRRDAAHFVARRWIRIAPPYLLASIPAVLLLLAIGSWRGARSILNCILFIPVADTSRYTLPPIDIGWTLSFEFTFYLMVAAMVAVHLADRMLILAGILVVTSSIGVLVSTPVYLVTWFTNPIFLEFALGLLVHELWQRGAIQRCRAWAIAAGVLGIGVIVTQGVVGYGNVSEAENVLDGSSSALRVLLWGLPIAMVAVGGIALGCRTDRTWNRAVLRLGDRSYSLYLVHIPLYLAIKVALAHSPVNVPALLLFPLAVAGALVLGYLYFAFVEKPVTRRMQVWYKRRSAAPASM